MGLDPSTILVLSGGASPPSLAPDAPPGLDAFALLLLGGGGLGTSVVDDRSAYPITVLGGLKARFKASPALVAALPGGLLAGVPDGRIATPYATIVEVGSTSKSVTKDRYRVVTTRFVLAVAGRTIGAVSDAFAAMSAAYSGGALIADPIPLRRGVVKQAMILNPHFGPSVEADRGGNLVRRRVADLATISVEWF